MKKISPYLEKGALAWSVGLAVMMLYGDYITGPYVSFPILFVFPVALLAWYRSCWWAILLAALLCAARQWMSLHWQPATHVELPVLLVNTLIRMCVLFLVAVLISRISRQHRELESRVRTLEGILPVCGFCKKIRNEENKWEPIEVFVTRHSAARFSHSVCPDCGYEHYPQFCEPSDPREAPATRE